MKGTLVKMLLRLSGGRSFHWEGPTTDREGPTTAKA